VGPDPAAAGLCPGPRARGRGAAGDKAASPHPHSVPPMTKRTQRGWWGQTGCPSPLWPVVSEPRPPAEAPCWGSWSPGPLGSAGCGGCPWHGTAWRAWHGTAWRAWHSMAWHSTHGTAWRAWQGQGAPSPCQLLLRCSLCCLRPPRPSPPAPTPNPRRAGNAREGDSSPPCHGWAGSSGSARIPGWGN